MTEEIDKQTIDTPLYPMKFRPILKPIIWGGAEICRFKNISPVQDGIGESWEISAVEGSISEVANGVLQGQPLDKVIQTYKEKLLGKRIFEQFGTTFPLLIKFIDAKQDLSIQVHPNDELAQARHNSFGKTEMWYVIDAVPGASLYAGFKRTLTPDTYEQSIQDGSFMEYLDKHSVSKGDVFFLPAGRVHSIGAGTFIAEIQQTSNITYRIFDYNRRDADGNLRELHTELAKEAIDFEIHPHHCTQYHPQTDEAVQLASCNYFTTNLLHLEKPLQRNYASLHSFVVYICVEGKLHLRDEHGNELTLKQGESALIPATSQDIYLSPVGQAKLLEAYG